MSEDRFVDLHAHTNFSDGQLSPEELVEEAQWCGISAIALTDHDNVDGLERFRLAGIDKGIETVPGVEISCDVDGREAHLVGLFIEPNENMHKRLSEFREQRKTRMQQMLDRLGEMGINIHIDEIPQEAGKSIGRPHLARALVKKGIVRDVSEAFGRYIGDDGPGYVPKLLFSFDDALNLVHDTGGLAILAHPETGAFVDMIPEFAKKGIDGAEAYFHNSSEKSRQAILKLCRDNNLLVSGGSDFHGKGHKRELGAERVPYSVLQNLRDRKESLCR